MKPKVYQLDLGTGSDGLNAGTLQYDETKTIKDELDQKIHVKDNTTIDITSGTIKFTGDGINSITEVGGEAVIDISGGGGSGTITSVNGDTGPEVTLTTDNISDELATNKYYSETLFDLSLSTKSTDDLTESPTNKYYSDILVSANSDVVTAVNHAGLVTGNPHNVTASDVSAIPTSEKGSANGVATLDANSKLTLSQIPDSIVGALEYKGTFDASGGSYPSSPEQGFYYVCNVAGTISSIDYEIGDWAVYNGTSWDKIDNSDKVTSVNGQTGIVDLTTLLINEDTNLYYTDSRVSANSDVVTAVDHAGLLSGNPHNVTASDVDAIPTSEKGTANGVATLDGNSVVPTTQLDLSSYGFLTDQVYPNLASFPATGEFSVIYIDLATSYIYLWNGSSYAQLSISPVTTVFGRDGIVTAQSNDYTWEQIDKTISDISDITNKSHTDLTDIGTNTHIQIDTHISSTSNPHSVTASQLTDFATEIDSNVTIISLTDDQHTHTNKTILDNIDINVVNAIVANSAHRETTSGNPHNVTAAEVSAVPLSDKGSSDGVATLDNSGKLTSTQIPDALLGSTRYMGAWDCSGGSYPSSPLQGDFYICSVSGTISGTLYNVGDHLIYNGSTWDKIDNTDSVTEVNGYIGSVTLDADDISDELTTKKYYSETLFDLSLSTKTTDDLDQGPTNKYYSSTLFDSSLSTKTTDDLYQGTTNKYYSDTLVSANTDVTANTSHRNTTSGNPHNVTASDVNCLAKDNITSYDPTLDYHPATKKYVDDNSYISPNYYSEILTISTINVIPNLTKTPINNDNVELFLEYIPISNGTNLTIPNTYSYFTVNGKSMTWVVNNGINLDVGDFVLVKYLTNE